MPSCKVLPLFEGALWLQGLHLRTLCVMLWVAILPALALPGLVASKGPQWLVSGLLLLQVRTYSSLILKA